MTTVERNYIMNQAVAEQKMRRMALEIIENNFEEDELILAGIHENGSVVAGNIQAMIAEFSSIKTKLISISLDKRMPAAVTLSETMNFDNKVIIVIDDVANSGKTLMYSLKPFLQYHPKKIQSLVLVERSHNSFPVHSDYAGISIATTRQEHIYVEVTNGNITGAYLK